jgi:hypothetical protein
METSPPKVFLLRRPVEVREDGFRTTHAPFVITYDHKDVYAAFTTAEVAEYFAHALGLDKAYAPISLGETDLADLTHAEHALVLRRKSQIDTLLRGKAMASFAQNLIKVR